MGPLWENGIDTRVLLIFPPRPTSLSCSLTADINTEYQKLIKQEHKKTRTMSENMKFYFGSEWIIIAFNLTSSQHYRVFNKIFSTEWFYRRGTALLHSKHHTSVIYSCSQWIISYLKLQKLTCCKIHNIIINTQWSENWWNKKIFQCLHPGCSLSSIEMLV